MHKIAPVFLIYLAGGHQKVYKIHPPTLMILIMIAYVYSNQKTDALGDTEN